MINYDSNFEKLKMNYENGIITENDISEEEMKKLTEYYKKEIESNKIDISIINRKIRNLKQKIDNLV